MKFLSPFIVIKQCHFGPKRYKKGKRLDQICMYVKDKKWKKRSASLFFHIDICIHFVGLCEWGCLFICVHVSVYIMPPSKHVYLFGNSRCDNGVLLKEFEISLFHLRTSQFRLCLSWLWTFSLRCSQYFLIMLKTTWITFIVIIFIIIIIIGVIIIIIVVIIDHDCSNACVCQGLCKSWYLTGDLIRLNKSSQFKGKQVFHLWHQSSMVNRFNTFWYYGDMYKVYKLLHYHPKMEICIDCSDCSFGS